MYRPQEINHNANIMLRLNGTVQGATSEQTAEATGGRTCLECGAPMDRENAKADRAEFCDTPCRRRFNNRRQLRGAALYDLIMALRYQRGTATRLKVWRLINRLAASYRAEDKQERRGRRSWRSPRAVILSMPWLRAEVYPAPKRRNR